jgi:hypothetical protein
MSNEIIVALEWLNIRSKYSTNNRIAFAAKIEEKQVNKDR